MRIDRRSWLVAACVATMACGPSAWAHDFPNKPFSAVKDLQGITIAGRVPMLLVVSSKVSANTTAELIESDQKRWAAVIKEAGIKPD